MNKIYSSVLISLFLSSTAFHNACAAQKIPQWQQEMNERAKELEELQRQNGSNVDLDINNQPDFPKTTDDLSFSARVQLEKEGLEPYKDMKAYRELNVKTAAEWCNDGDHTNSPECVVWRCSEGGKDAATTGCITWRCAKPEYYNEHVEECKRNKLCAKNNKSAECMRYRCYETNDQNLDECKKWKCENDSSFSDTHKTQCAVAGQDCTASISDPHVQSAEYDSSARCIIKECTSGWKPNENGSTCVADSGSSCTPTDNHAVAGVYDDDGSCKITECADLFEPNSDRTACREVTTYYYLKIYSVAAFGIHDVTDDGLFPGSSKMCYAVCGSSSGGDDVNKKVLNPILHASYCVPDSIFSNKIMKNVNTGEEIKFTRSKYEQIRDGLVSIKDTGECDWHHKDIVAEIYKHEGNKDSRVDYIVLDD